MKYVLGLDIGVASVGWAVIDKENGDIIESGVRLFNSADASQNEERRNSRGVRRNKRRQQNRLITLENYLKKHDVIEPKKHDLEPVEVRCKGLKEKLEKDELYVALYNIVKHRGISYFEDIEEDEKNQDGLNENAKLLKVYYPCEIQLDRLKKHGFYRNKVDDKFINNIFTTKSYEKEMREILINQKKYYQFIDDDFIEKVVEILRRKREYYVGPGNEKSRTNYGRFKTEKNDDGTYKTVKNIFDELRGKCSIYNGKNGGICEFRAASASWTAQYYNLLNDLCNIKINDNKLTKQEKEEVIEVVKASVKSQKITKILKNLYKVDENEVKGLRINKDGKEESHSLDVYRKMANFFRALDLSFDYSINQLDAIAVILTLNTETQAMKNYFEDKESNEYVLLKDLSEKEKEAFIEFRRKNSKIFNSKNKWHSFSCELMKKITPYMLETGNEQQTVINDLGLKKYNQGIKDTIDVKDILDEIYNPVVSRSVRQTVKIINALMKKHSVEDGKRVKYEFSDIIIEMPREKNSEEQKKSIINAQKSNEKLIEDARKMAGLENDEEWNKALKGHNSLPLKLKLYYKQNGKCLYSGDDINIPTLLKNDKSYEIDHIIPISISFDDSQSNKVLVKHGENQSKGNLTPFRYLKSKSGWNYETYKAYVLDLYNKKLIGKRHKDNLLFEEDITKQDVVKGFIARNLNDTRFASKVILNQLDSFFKDRGTNIKVVNGAITQQFRNSLLTKKERGLNKEERLALTLSKDRDRDYRHHAVDAMICCYTSMSIDKYGEQYINMESGDILNKEKIEQLDDNRGIYLSYSNFIIRGKIEDFYEKIKFSYKVDRKVNRAVVSKSTIYGTRKNNDEIYIIQKLDLYDGDRENQKKIKKLVDKLKGEASSSITYLMELHDVKTWNEFKKIVETYPGEDNPFQKYVDDNGEKIRKYSKKGNGPFIKILKYFGDVVADNRGIDITHKYKDSRNKILLDGKNPYRTDVFYDNAKNNYIYINVCYSDFKFIKNENKYGLNIDDYASILIQSGINLDKMHYNSIVEFINHLETKQNIEFRFSLYDNDILEIVEKNEVKKYRHHSMTELKGIDSELEKRKRTITKKTNHFLKINTDILGNEHKVFKEKLILEFELDNDKIL